MVELNPPGRSPSTTAAIATGLTLKPLALRGRYAFAEEINLLDKLLVRSGIFLSSQKVFPRLLGYTDWHSLEFNLLAIVAWAIESQGRFISAFIAGLILNLQKDAVLFHDSPRQFGLLDDEEFFKGFHCIGVHGNLAGLNETSIIDNKGRIT